MTTTHVHVWCPGCNFFFLHKSKRCTQTINNKMGKWLSCYPENASLALTDCQVVFQNKKRTVLSWSDTATRLLPSCCVTKIHKKVLLPFFQELPQKSFMETLLRGWCWIFLCYILNKIWQIISKERCQQERARFCFFCSSFYPLGRVRSFESCLVKITSSRIFTM